MSPTAEQITERLREVIDPELRRSIVDLGMVRSIEIAAGGRVLTDRTLLQRVWGPEYGSENHYLHVYIGRLRKKLEPDPARPRYLRTEPGVGYRLVEIDAGE